MIVSRTRRLVIALVATSAVASVARAGVRTVGVAPSEFTNIAAAVAAAQEGDILLVRAGTYLGFTVDGKGLSILADDGADVQVSSLVRVKNLAPAQCVVLSGLVVNGWSTNALVLLDVQGAVRVQSCTLRVAPDLSLARVHGATVTNTASAAFADVLFLGGAPVQSFALPGDGLRVESSHVALSGCTLSGGPGAPGNFGQQAPGTNGGAGLTLLSGDVYASDTSFRGGPGGRGGVQPTGSPGCAGQVPLAGGRGGHGLDVAAGAFAELRASAGVGGAGGLAGTTVCGAHGTDGTAGVGMFGNVTVVAEASRTMHAARVAREGQTATLRFDGQPGDRVMLFLATGPAGAWQASAQGVVLVQNPFSRRVGIGMIPASGTLVTALPVPELGVGVAGTLRHVQAWVVDATGGGHVGSASVLLLLDSAM